MQGLWAARPCTPHARAPALPPPQPQPPASGAPRRAVALLLRVALGLQQVGIGGAQRRRLALQRLHPRLQRRRRQLGLAAQRVLAAGLDLGGLQVEKGGQAV